MIKALKLAFLVLALSVGTSTLAYAHDTGDHRDQGPGNGDCNNTAPEVDPGMAIGGLSLLGGAIAVARARRQK